VAATKSLACCILSSSPIYPVEIVGIDFKDSWLSVANERETHKLRCTFKIGNRSDQSIREVGIRIREWPRPTAVEGGNTWARRRALRRLKRWRKRTHAGWTAVGAHLDVFSLNACIACQGYELLDIPLVAGVGHCQVFVT
jgi:hypothetical protein